MRTEWAHLGAVLAYLARIETALEAARVAGNASLARTLGEQLDQAERMRSVLISRIGAAPVLA